MINATINGIKGKTSTPDTRKSMIAPLFIALRPLKIVHFCLSPRKAKILTTPVRSAGPTGQAGIH
jgi:hypothetical protein